MGLDITAYKNAKLVEVVKDDDEYNKKYSDRWREGFDFVYEFSDFADRLPPLKPNGVYQSKDSIGFRAGSYSGYNHWRAQLCQMALGVDPNSVWNNPAAFEDGPFVELINFSDCEGHLGTNVCKKLLDDFEEWKSQANKMGGYFYELYEEWRKAFEYAANNGYISFH